jgi:hypothetical protein
VIEFPYKFKVSKFDNSENENTEISTSSFPNKFIYTKFVKFEIAEMSVYASVIRWDVQTVAPTTS